MNRSELIKMRERIKARKKSEESKFVLVLAALLLAVLFISMSFI